jgi:FkbM family methyltransferase
VTTIRNGRAAGLRINTRSGNPGYGFGTTEPVVQDAIATALRPGGVFYDLGANVGFFTLVGAKAVGDVGRVYAFEPDADNAAALRKNVALNSLDRVEVIEAAVSDFDGEASLVGEGIKARLEEGGRDVRVVKLDSLDILPPDMVKIDVEQAEEQVIAGMRRLIDAHRPTILCEMHMHGPVGEAVATLAEWLPADYSVRSLEEAEADELAARPHVLATPAAGALGS